MVPEAPTHRMNAQPGSVVFGVSPARRDEARPWVGLSSSWTLFGAVLFGALSFFFLFEALPFQDLPAHAGLIALRHRHATSPFEQAHYVFSPGLGPYSLFRGLGELLVHIVSPVTAVRILGALPLVGTPLAVCFMRIRLFGDKTPTSSYIALMLCMGLMTMLGFASYQLAVAVLLVAYVLWLELLQAWEGAPSPPVRRALFFSAVAPLVFFAHGHAFLLLLFLAGLSWLAGSRRRNTVAAFVTFVPAVVLVSWVAFRERLGALPEGAVSWRSSSFVTHFSSPLDKLGLLLTPTLLTRSGLDMLLCVSLWGLSAFGIWCSRRRKAPQNGHASRLQLCALGLFGVFLVLPHSVGWFGFMDGRVLPLVLILGLSSLELSLLPRWFHYVVRRGAPLSAALLVTLALFASGRFQSEAEGYREVLAAIPEQSRVLNLPLEPDSDVFAAHPFIHYDKLALAEKPLVVSDVWFHQGTALFPTKDNPVVRLPESYSESNLPFVEWPSYPLSEWDYVLIRMTKESPEPKVPTSLSLHEHRGGWWLYRTRKVY